MQSHGITFSFHREMADSSRELVRPDITDAASFESYPRFIKGGFQDYEGLGIKRFTADSKHVPSLRSRLLGKQRLLESPPESSRIFGITLHFGQSFQIEAIEHRGTSGELPDQLSNQAQEVLLLWSVASRDEQGADLNVGDLAA
jgi:hypothetical protein